MENCVIYIRIVTPERDQDKALEWAKPLAAQIGGEAQTPATVHENAIADMPLHDRVEYWGDDR